MTVQELINQIKNWGDLDVTNILIVISIVVLIYFTFRLMFFWEGKVKWWLRLPVINLVTFTVLLFLGIIEELYLTFHPKERTTYFRTSIFQTFFMP